jgi:hypothetical protein
METTNNNCLIEIFAYLATEESGFRFHLQPSLSRGRRSPYLEQTRTGTTVCAPNLSFLFGSRTQSGMENGTMSFQATERGSELSASRDWL